MTVMSNISRYSADCVKRNTTEFGFASIQSFGFDSFVCSKRLQDSVGVLYFSFFSIYRLIPEFFNVVVLTVGVEIYGKGIMNIYQVRISDETVVVCFEELF